jgi:Zn-dependent protease
MENFIQQAALFIPPFLLAISFHESAHAYVAWRFGDPTARDMGRITLNPLPHIDILGLFVLLIAHFGWAKPVPVNPYNLKNPIKDNLWIALAGPASNLILAIISAIVFRIVAPFLQYSAAGGFILTMILLSVSLNLVLMTFNLFPIPPLDGFHILEGLVSTEMYIKLQRLEQIGPIILLIIIMASNFGHLNIFGAIFNPVVGTLGGLLLGRPIGW